MLSFIFSPSAYYQLITFKVPSESDGFSGSDSYHSPCFVLEAEDLSVVGGGGQKPGWMVFLPSDGQLLLGTAAWAGFGPSSPFPVSHSLSSALEGSHWLLGCLCSSENVVSQTDL